MVFISFLKNWKSPECLLYLMAAAVPFSFAAWQTLLNNFAVEQAQFTGAEIGILQSLREVPGFIAFVVGFTCYGIFNWRWFCRAFIGVVAVIPWVPQPGTEVTFVGRVIGRRSA